MPGSNRDKLTRRTLLGASVALASPIAGLSARGAHAQAPAKTPTKVLDFHTYADVAKAEQEGAFVFYGHENEAGIGGDRSRRSARTSRRSRPAMSGPRPARCTTRSRPSAPPAASTSTCSSSPTSPRRSISRRRAATRSTTRRKPAATSPNTSAIRPAPSSGPASPSAASPTIDRQGEGRGGAEELEGSARSEVAQRHELQDLHLGHAARAVVRAAQALRRRVLAGVRQAAPARLRFAGPALRPARQGRRQGLRARRVRGLHPLQGEGRGDRVRRAGRRPAGDAAPASGSSTRRRIRRPPSSSSTGRCRTAGRRSTRAIRT